MNLTIKPHVSGGFYDTVTAPARSSITVNLWGSYDSAPVTITRCHVVNLHNDGNVAFTLPDGSLQSTLPPYVNRDIQLPGINNVTIVNEGTSDVTVMFADDKMIGLANDVYAAIPTVNVESQFTIVNNFELSTVAAIENEGTENGVVYTPVGGLTLSGTPKFGNRCILYVDTSGNDSSGLLLSKTGLFDMGANWTIEMFIYGQMVNDTTLLRIANDSVLNNSFTIYKTAGFTMSVNAFNTVDNTWSVALNAGAYNHIAISKVGTTIKFYCNGALALTMTGIGNTTKFNNFYLGYSNLNNASYKNFTSFIDAFAFHNALALYTVPFTPRTSAPI